ncbi:hypothetical protein HPB47_009911, partial [Ixodes persulcatus]
DPLRVLQAKSNLGKMLRGCGREFTKMMKELPNDDFQKRMNISCQVYNVCRSTPIKTSSQEVFNCLWKEIQENGVPWTLITNTPELRHAGRNVMVCWNRTLLPNLPLERLDDAVAYARQFAFRF